MAKNKTNPNWGGVRPNSGRPTMFPGEKVKTTVKLTKVAVAAVRRKQAELAAVKDEDVTFGQTVEYLIRRATKTPLED